MLIFSYIYFYRNSLKLRHLDKTPAEVECHGFSLINLMVADEINELIEYNVLVRLSLSKGCLYFYRNVTLFLFLQP